MATQLTRPLRGRILALLRICIAMGALAVVFFSQDFSELAGILSQLKISVLSLAVLLFIVANVIISLRWYLLLRAQNADIAILPAVKIHFLGLFYNNILLSSIGGDMLRAWYITRHTNRRVEAVFSVIVDRVIGLGTLVIFAAILLMFFPLNSGRYHIEKPENLNITALLSAHKNVVILLLGCIAATTAVLMFSSRLRNIAGDAITRLFSARKRLYQAFRLYLRRPLVILAAVVLTFLAQSISISGLYFIGRTLALPVPAVYYFVFFPLSWVIGAIPVSPGGIGVLELGVVGLFVLTGCSVEQASVLAICQRGIFLIGSLAGAAVHIAGAHLPAVPKDFSVD